MMEKALLEVRNLVSELPTDKGVLHIINNVSFQVGEEECFGIIGESGCGKTMTSMSILRYAERIGLQAVSGGIYYKGESIFEYTKSQLKEYNGHEVAMIMQDPMSALDPLYTIEDQILETIRRHQKVSKQESIRQMQEIATMLSISEEKLKCYPHQLSGGMLQRIVGAIVVSCHPKLIIADEPTTALDVTTQLQYLKLLKQIQREYRTAIIFISHDIKVVSMMCDRIAVMYAGHIVETADRDALFSNPQHPYTKALFHSASLNGIPQGRYETIEGNPPDLHEKITGCAFANRCPYSGSRCMKEAPPCTTLGDTHEVYCWRMTHEENN
jgi:oligopeptide/dipeptide ABC transporter ATP-binding protein